VNNRLASTLAATWASIISCVLAAALGAGCTARAGDPPASTSTATAAATGPATITTDAATYTYATPVVVTWTGLHGNPTDWIALAPAGSPLTTTPRWAYVGTPSGTTDGSLTFEGPVPGGSYVARAFDDNTFTLMGESDPFSVADASDTHATLALDAADYAIDQPITMTWTGMPPNAKDWVGIAPVGSPSNVVANWLYDGGTADGSITFKDGEAFASQQGFPGGLYVARLFLNDTYTPVAETAPVLIGSLVTTDAATYAPSTPITVDWTHMPGKAGDWVALVPAGAAPSTLTSFTFTDQSQNGSQVFAAGVATPGTYVARTFAPDTYFISGESAPFTVTTGVTATVTTDQASYALGQTITVSWTGLSSNPKDWIAIAPDGSDDTTVTRWFYTGVAASGSFVFEGPATAGTYVARAFFNDTYVKVGQSAAFPVH
jgi:hypothetical protein